MKTWNHTDAQDQSRDDLERVGEIYPPNREIIIYIYIYIRNKPLAHKTGKRKANRLLYLLSTVPLHEDDFLFHEECRHTTGKRTA